MDTKANLIGIKANAMLNPDWLPIFNANWQTLKSSTVRNKVQATGNAQLIQLYVHLLDEAQNIYTDLQNDYSIPSADVQEWQDNVANLAHRIGMNVPIEAVQGYNKYQDTLDRTAGVYQTVRDTAAGTLPPGGTQIGFRFPPLPSEDELKMFALIGMAAIAGLVLLPHLFRGGER